METEHLTDEPFEVPEGARLEGLSKNEGAEAERAARRALPAFFRVIDDVLKTAMVVMLVVLILAVAINVFGRFVLNESLATSDELSRFLFIWVIFLGAALAHLHREHIAVDLLVSRLPRPAQRVMTVVQELLVATLLIALLVSAYRVMSFSPGVSPLLRVPLNLVNASVPFGAVIMLIITCYRIAAVFRPAGRTAKD